MSDAPEDELPNPEPATNAETEPFWEATTEGRLLIQQCLDCGEPYYYPRANCPHCLSGETEWLETEGEGTIYTYTVTHQVGIAYTDFDSATPYVLAYVELDEGPRMLTNVVNCDHDDLSVGQRVTVTFDDTGGDAALPRFTPVE